MALKPLRDKPPAVVGSENQDGDVDVTLDKIATALGFLPQKPDAADEIHVE